MDEIIIELRSSDLSLDDLGCILDTILADLRAALTHSLSTATASSKPPRVENNQSSIQHPTPTTAPERYRELEMKNKALEEQNSRLRMNLRKIIKSVVLKSLSTTIVVLPSWTLSLRLKVKKIVRIGRK